MMTSEAQGQGNGRSAHLTTFPVWENYKATRLLTVTGMEDKHVTNPQNCTCHRNQFNYVNFKN